MKLILGLTPALLHGALADKFSGERGGMILGVSIWSASSVTLRFVI